MRPSRPVDRRAFLKAGGLVLAATALGAAKPPVKPTPVPPGEKMAEGIGPVEDLMREHGVLLRVLLIYEESARRIETGTALPAGVVADAAGGVVAARAGRGVDPHRLSDRLTVAVDGIRGRRIS